MGYSITPILHHHADKEGKQKVIIQVIMNRIKTYCNTPVKVHPDNFDNGSIVKHPLKTQYNLSIRQISQEVEKRLYEALQSNIHITKERLTEIVKGGYTNAVVISDFIYDQVDVLKGRLTPGRLRHYNVAANKIEAFRPKTTFDEITAVWLTKYEAWLRLRGLDNNTVLSQMNLFIGILNKAVMAGLIKKEKFSAYKRPRYEQKMAEYLTEEEIEKFYNLVKVIEKPSHKLAGYYYILSCYTGYRISDAKQFDYNNSFIDGSLKIRAKKNKAIVSTPIFPRLAEILEFIKDKPLHLSEEKTRQYIKELFLLVGIKKDISFHSARHSFAMLLMKKGFTRDEVSHYIGDSLLVTKVYARLHNDDLDRKIMDRLG